MRILRAVGIGFITGIVGAFLSMVAADYLTQLYHVSNMEGGRGMFVVFIFGPLGFIVGFLCGLITALITPWSGGVGFLKTQGVALGVTAGLAVVVSGLAWLGVDHPPTLNGRPLVLEFELKIPPGLALPSPPNEDSIRASLYANNRDNRYATIDINGITVRDGMTIIPGKAGLGSRSANRDLLAYIGNEPGASQFMHLQLPSNPGTDYENWSDWIVAKERADLTPIPEPERMAVRYRVRPAE